MTESTLDPAGRPVSRRQMLRIVGTTAGAAMMGATAHAQAPQGAPPPPPPPAPFVPRDYSPGGLPVSYPDPDIVTIDPAFNALRVNNTAIQRLWTGGMWSEGPAWCNQGKYLVWSDVPMGVQRRWIEDDGRVTVFRNPSNN